MKKLSTSDASKPAKTKRILVLAVDVDDDIGRVGIQTPVIGRASLMKAAVDFALRRPEDSDTNVLFSALSLADKLSKEGYDVEVALVAGDPIDPIKADLRIREQVEAIVKALNVDGIVLVSDGAEDERVIPILQSIAPIISVKRVIVEQLRGVEETYILIGRYIKKIIEEPRFARLFLGVPGMVLAIISALALLNMLQYALTVAFLIIGLAMIVRGFELDQKIQDWWASSPITSVALILSSISFAIGIGVAAFSIQQTTSTIHAIASVINVLTPFIGFSVTAIFTARAIVKIMSNDTRVWHDVAGLIITAMMVIALYNLAQTLSKLPATAGPESVLEAIIESRILLWLFATIIVAIILTTIFTLVEDKLRSMIKR